MNFEIFDIFTDNKLEVVIIGIIAFILTYLFKLPIKSATKNLSESKRKMVNTVIVFIPLLIAVISSELYYGLNSKLWLSWIIVDCSISAWLISLSLYAIVSKLFLVANGLFSNQNGEQEAIDKETKNNIKKQLNYLLKQIKIDENSISIISKKITQCLKLKALLTDNSTDEDLTKISQINAEIYTLQEQKKELDSSISKKEETVLNYKNQLNIK